MVRLDSIRLKAPMTAIKDVNIDLFKHRTDVSNGQVLDDKYTLNNLDVGIKQIEINKHTDSVFIEMSAKALKRDYVQGINRNTIQRVIDSIDKSIININAGSFIDESIILRADVTDNVNIGVSNDEIIQALSTVPLSVKYDVTAYDTKTNLGVVWKGKQKSFKERQIFYDKYKDLRYNKSNKELRSQVPLETLYGDFKDTIRVETNLTSFATLRKYLGSQELKTVLSSDTKTNYTVFKKITGTANERVMELFSRYEGMNIRQVIRTEGIRGIIKNSNNDWSFIDRFLRAKSPNNYRSYRTEFKRHYNELNETSQRAVSIIDMISDKLSQVA